MPDRRWIMAQSWCDLLFAHWPVPVDDLRELVPEALDIDTFDGKAWVGLVPFRMQDVYLRGMPPLFGTGAFPELNVRTYVVHRDRPGVWFFSLDAASKLAVAVARRWFRLPYFRARMTCRPAGEDVVYACDRTHAGAAHGAFEGTYGPRGAVQLADSGSIDHWLTERYCLYAGTSDRLLRAEIQHAPWPLQPGWAEISHESMVSAAGISLPPRAPLLHFARRLDVVCWAPTRVS